MIMINDESGFTQTNYSGTNLSEIYVGEHLVWPVNTDPPTGGSKVTYILSGNTYSIDCDNVSILTRDDFLLDLENVNDIDNITDVTIGECITETHPNCFNDWDSLSGVTIPSTVKKLGYQTFYNCKSISALTIPNKVTEFTSHLFAGCYELSSINIPNKVTSIGANAFYDCLSLNNITIPSGVTSIGDSAFRCSNWSSSDTYQYNKMKYLKDNRVVICLPTTPPTIGTTPFSIIGGGSEEIATYPIYVPAESVDVYKAAWTYLADRIKPIE